MQEDRRRRFLVLVLVVLGLVGCDDERSEEVAPPPEPVASHASALTLCEGPVTLDKTGTSGESVSHTFTKVYRFEIPTRYDARKSPTLTAATASLTYEVVGGTSIVCTYSYIASPQGMVFTSCSGGQVANDIVTADRVTLTITSTTPSNASVRVTYDIAGGGPEAACAIDACTAQPVSYNCGDSNPCNGSHACQAGGVCEFSEPILSDGDPCTADSCDPVSGFHHDQVPAGTSCDTDNLFCNGTDTCDASGDCIPGDPVEVDDDNVCTTDACEEHGIGVTHTPIEISDADDCTVDTCDPVTGVAHTSCTLLEPGVTTTIAGGTTFLYEGTDPPQTGVAPGTIQTHRASVITGTVVDLDNFAVPGATIRVLGFPEFGETVTDGFGSYYLVVNGGAEMVVDIDAVGYFPVQRRVQTHWNDYAHVDAIALTKMDTEVTTIALDDVVGMVSAQSSPTTDLDGTRQITLLVPEDTTATAYLSDDTPVALDTISVRMTEYTVGSTGRAAMPGELPASSAYTFAFEASVDQALDVGAVSVVFNQPLPIYVDNFLGFATDEGNLVPVGFYDRQRGVWVPSENGRIVQVVSVTGGVASLDVDGDLVADSGSALLNLGITSDELAEVGALFSPGESFLRFMTTHFSSIDCNWPGFPNEPNCGVPPCSDTGSGGSGGQGGTGGQGGSGGGGQGGGGQGGGGQGGGGQGGQGADGDECEGTEPCGGDQQLVEEPIECRGSIIECENQVLGERFSVAGTPFTLNYRSDRVPGNKSAYKLTVPVTLDPPPPASVKRIEVEAFVAGKRYESEPFICPCDANEKAVFEWDGLDVFGRALRGRQPVQVNLTYVYSGHYGLPPNQAAAFAATPSLKVLLDEAEDRLEFPTTKYWRGSIGTSGTLAPIGGWTLDVHHSYDVASATLFMGDGTRRTYQGLSPSVKLSAGGTATSGWTDGVNALSANLHNATEVVIGPDGSKYVVTGVSNDRIRRVLPNGLAYNFAGGGPPVGNGVPATQTRIEANGLAIDQEGGVLLSDASTIRRIGTDGIIERIAGVDGTAGNTGDGGDALSALINPTALAVYQGEVYFVQEVSNAGVRVRKIRTDGIIETFAGGGSGSGTTYPAGVPAKSVHLNLIMDLAFGADGSLYLARSGQQHGKIDRIRPDGTIDPVAGYGPALSNWTPFDELDPAVDATLLGMRGLTVRADGTVFGVMRGSGGVQHGRTVTVSPSGQLSTLLARPWPDTCPGRCNMSGAAPNGDAIAAEAIALGPAGGLHVADFGSGNTSVPGALLEIVSPMPGLQPSAEIIVPSKDGSEIFLFDQLGRHLETRDATTGIVKWTFGYTDGLLTSIVDAAGQPTTIHRTVGGEAEAIEGPFGVTTDLQVSPTTGYLGQIMNPEGEVTILEYNDGPGLLTDVIDPETFEYHFTYDDKGRLELDEDPAGGWTELARSGTAHDYTVTRTTGELRKYVSSVDTTMPLTQVRSSVADPEGAALTNSQTRFDDGARTTDLPDGRLIEMVVTPDPRFGMLSPLSTTIETTPVDAKVRTITRGRSVTLSDPLDVLSATSITDTTSINGKTFSSVMTLASGTRVVTTPEGRQVTTVVNGDGQITSLQIPGDLARTFGYDTSGRLETQTQGARITTLEYDPDNGYLQSVEDAMEQLTTYQRDDVGRALLETRNDLSEVTFGFDDNGNLTALTPPGKPEHGMGYSEVNLLKDYDPPSLDAGTTFTPTDHGYNLDRQLDWILHPTAVTVDYEYDDLGRLWTISYPGETITRGYDPGGRLWTLDGPGNLMLTYGYDGHLLKTITYSGDVAATITRGYDNDFRLTSEQINSEPAIIYGYDDDGLLTSAGPLTIVRDPFNGRVTDKLVSNISDHWEYSQYGEVESYTSTYNGSTLLYAYEIVLRDELGRIKEKTETIQGVTTGYAYDYDTAGRLWRVWIDDVLDATYGYDDNGNRTSVTTAGGTVSAMFDEQDRITSQGTTTFGHNFKGELELIDDPAGGTALWFDALGKLGSVEVPTATITYTHAGQGQRIGHYVDQALERSLLWKDQVRPLAQLNAVGGLAHTYIHAESPNAPEVILAGATTYRLVKDHLGSPRLVVNAATGTVVQRLDYDCWGATTNDTNAGFQPYGFGGGLYQPESNLVTFGARTYSPAIGRWTAKDPVRFDGGVNLYVFANNDPINQVDPTGLWPTPWEIYDAAIAAAEELVYAAETGNGDVHLYGMHNGTADAFKHCLASCRMAHTYGETIAGIFGWANEVQATMNGQPREQADMDFYNNQCGYDHAGYNCYEDCLMLVESGQLRVLY